MIKPVRFVTSFYTVKLMLIERPKPKQGHVIHREAAKTSTKKKLIIPCLYDHNGRKKLTNIIKIIEFPKF